MTRFMCKLGLVAAIVLGVFAFSASPAEAQSPYYGRPVYYVQPYYPPQVTVYPAPIYVTPVYNGVLSNTGQYYAAVPVYNGVTSRIGSINTSVNFGVGNGAFNANVGIGRR